jgi:hypothetical protein
MTYRKVPLPANAELFAWADKHFQYLADGQLFFKVDPRAPQCLTSKVIGKPVGGDDGHGYLMCMLMGHKAKVHQVVWLLHFQSFPTMPLDHVNRDKRDNRVENLRLASDLENMQNLTASTRPNAGITKPPRASGYTARITQGGQKRYLGTFPTPEDAQAAYRKAKRELSGRFSPV